MPKMTDEDLQDVVSELLNDALGFENTAVSQSRQKAIKYYNGDLVGNELPGRSKIVSRDVSDTIGILLPAVIKKFNSTNEAVQFEATTPEGETEAEEKTQVANYVFYKENEGALILYDLFFDALLEKNGYLKVYNDEKEDHTTETYQNLSDEEYMLLITSPDYDTVKILSHTTSPAHAGQETDPSTGQPAPVSLLHNIKLRNTKKSRKTVIEVIPPEEFIISSNAISIDKAQVKGHRRRMTHSELMEMGIDVEKLDYSASVADYGLNNIEAQQRFKDENYYTSGKGLTSDKSTHEVWVTEFYANVDYDGDGIAELRYLLVIGDTSTNIVKNEEVDTDPYVDITPIRIPHKHRGQSIADLIYDVQDNKTATLRQAMDNMYLANNKRIFIPDTTGVDIDALLSGRANSVIMCKTTAGIQFLEHPDLGAAPYNMLGYLDSVKSNRTGEGQYSQVSDSNSLNSTATGANLISTLAQQREDLIASLFAQGLKKLFKKIIEIEVKNGISPRQIKAAGEWKAIDPREWKFQDNVTINVGLGTGNKDQMLGHLQTIASLQAAMLQSQTLSGLVSADNAYNTAAQIVKNSGLVNPEKYFTDPAKQEQQQNPQAQAAQQAQQQAQQMQMQQVQSQQKAVEADLQIKAQKMKNDHEEFVAKLHFETEKTMKELALKEKELELKYHQTFNPNTVAHTHQMQQLANAATTQFTNQFNGADNDATQ